MHSPAIRVKATELDEIKGKAEPINPPKRYNTRVLEGCYWEEPLSCPESWTLKKPRVLPNAKP